MAIAETRKLDTSPLDSLLQSHPLPTWRVLAWPIIIRLIAAMTWAYYARLEEFAVVDGEVVPLGNIKTVQHLEGGIVEEIFVRDGDAVAEGDPLLHLDLGSGGTNIEELQVRLDSALLVNARLAAEATGDALSFPTEVAERRPGMVVAQRQTYEARLSELESSIGILRDQERQKELEVDEFQAQRNAIAKNLMLANERLQLSASLLQEGLTARIEHLELQAEVESLEGELNSIDQSIPRAQSGVEESQGRIEEALRRFRREAKEELSESEQSLARVQELLSQANQQGVRAVIKSPAAGIVQNMAFTRLVASSVLVKPFWRLYRQARLWWLRRA